MFKHFTKNTIGRDFAIGDIHGHFSAVTALLDHIGFDREKDRLFSVGDLVDRGPESNDVLTWLAFPWFHAVSGNHEAMAIDYAGSLLDAGNYRANGGGWNMDNPPARQFEIAEALKALPIAMEVETDAGLVGLVHAECPAKNWGDFRSILNGDLKLQPHELEHVKVLAQWMRGRVDSLDESRIADVEAVVVGHTPVRRATSLGNTIFIDTGGWLPTDRGGGQFTILDLATLRPVGLPPRAGALDWS